MSLDGDDDPQQSSPPPKKDNNNNQGGSSVNAGAIAGAVIGGVALVAFLAFAAWWLMRRKRIAAEEEEAYYRQAAADQEKYGGTYGSYPEAGEVYVNPPPTANSRDTAYSQGSNVIPIAYVSGSHNASLLSPNPAAADGNSSVRPNSVTSSLARSSIASSFMVGDAATQAQAVRPAVVEVSQTPAPANSTVSTKPNTPNRSSLEAPQENEGEKPMSKAQAIMGGSIVARAMTAKPIEILKGKMTGSNSNNNNANKNTAAASDSSNQSAATDSTTQPSAAESTDPSSRDSSQTAPGAAGDGRGKPPPPPSPIAESDEPYFDAASSPMSEQGPFAGRPQRPPSVSGLSIDNVPEKPDDADADVRAAPATPTGGRNGGDSPSPFADPDTPQSGRETPFADRFATH